MKTRREGMNLTKVVVQNGNVDLALKKFKAKVARSGVPSEISGPAVTEVAVI